MRAVEKRLRERVKELEGQVTELEQDRDKFREYFVGKYKWWIELLGKNDQPSLPWLIEDGAKFLARAKRWYW